MAGRSRLAFRPSEAERAALASPIEPFARKVLQKRWKRARDAGRTLNVHDDEQAHRLRIALKKLRYSADFFRSLFPGRKAGAYLLDATSLQERLEHLNDVAVSRTLIGRLIDRQGGDTAAVREAAGIVIGWHAHAAHLAKSDLARTWRSFARAQLYWKA